MRKTGIVYLFSFLLFACSGEQQDDTLVPDNGGTVQQPVEAFADFNQKISYCIGMDHGFTCSQVYEGPNTKGKFLLPDIEQGMLDYLGDADLRFDIFSVDSVLNLYLLENGQVSEAFVSKSDASYAVGMIEAQTLVGSLVGRGIDQKTDVDQLLKGVSDGMNHRETLVPLGEARNEVAIYFSDINQALGENFLKDNALNESVIVTESGLQYEVIQEGTGIKPNLTDSCVVHYTGRFIDGRVFESTVPSNIPAAFTPLGVIRGWQEGLLLMSEGSSYRFYIPYDLAYGEQGSGPIEPYSTLVFDIDLIKVKRFKP